MATAMLRDYSGNPTRPPVSKEDLEPAAWGPGGKYAPCGVLALSVEGGIPTAWRAAKARREQLGSLAGPSLTDVAFALLVLQQLLRGDAPLPPRTRSHCEGC
jgi:hypothetical protein